MHCHACGTKLPDSTAFRMRYCNACGAQLTDTPDPAGDGAHRDGGGPGGAGSGPSAFEPGAGIGAGAKELLASAKVECPKCKASVGALLTQCPNCGAETDSSKRFQAILEVAKAHKVPLKEVATVIRSAKLKPGARRSGLRFLLWWTAFWILIGGSAVAGGFPGTQKMAAPVLCPANYQQAIVPVEITYPEGGGVSISGSLYCIDKEGFAVEISAVDAHIAVGLIVGAFAAAPFLLMILIGALRRGLGGSSTPETRGGGLRAGRGIGAGGKR